jgi:2'-5' RNA ligase
MQLHAVIVAPPGVVADAAETARRLVEAQVPGEESRPGLMARLRRRPAEPAPAVTFAPADPGAVFVRLAKFGNVTSTDASSLASALTAVAATWPAPHLHVSGVSVGQGRPIDVTARLDGDVEALAAIYRNLNDAAKREGFFLDRRSFRSEVTVGEVQVPDGAVVPDTLPGATVEDRGAEWQPTHISFLRSVHRADGPAYEEIRTLALATGSSSER